MTPRRVKWLLTGPALALVAACSHAPALENGGTPTIAQVRDELLGYVGGIPEATGYRYGVTDDMGHVMDTAKIIQVAETGDFAAVYHWWSKEKLGFVVSLATSDDLLNWTWQVDLGSFSSQPYLAAASDGGYVVAWEQEPPSRDESHVRLTLFDDWEGLRTGTPSRVFDAHRRLSPCAEGTPNIYSASRARVDFGFHYYADCESDRQGRGSTDWITWEAAPQVQLDRAALFQGYRGSIGDREAISFRGHEFTFLESQFTQDDWRTFRFLLYDEELGSRDPTGLTAGAGDAPPEPPSVHVFMRTHRGSSSFTNLTATEVTIDGHRALVFGVFIPQEGARGGEAGQLIYYRIIDDDG